MKLYSQPQILDFDPFNTRTEAEATHGLGEVIFIGDGRAFRHGKAGAAVSAGKLSLAPTQKTNHHNCTAIASAINTTAPTFTLGATATVADEYDEGWVSVNVTPDVGHTYKISYMGLIGSGGTATPTLYEGLIAAWTTSTRVSLIHNPWNNAVETATSTIRGAGVPQVAIGSGDYGWYLSHGVSAVLCDTTTTLGAKQKQSGSVAGSVTDMTDILGASAEVEMGTADIMAGANTEYRPITVTID